MMQKAYGCAMQEYLYVLSRHENDTIYRFTSMARVICTLVHEPGRYVRYKRHWHLIREKRDFDLLVNEIQQKKARIEFVGSNGASLPFIDPSSKADPYFYPQALQIRW
jgi:hypothetical protein